MLKHTLRSLIILCMATLALQAQDKQTSMKVMELGLRQVASIPAIMKNYVMVEIGHKFNNPQAELDKEIARFKSLQEELMALSVDDETRAVLEKHQKMWEALDAELHKPIDHEQFKALKTYTTPLRKSIKKMIRETKAKVGDDKGEALYYTGKLSAVSQKFASLYMLLKWGMDNEKLHKDMAKQKEMYAMSLKKLDAITLTDEKSKEVLKELRKDLQYFTFLEQSSKTFMPALVYKKTNHMFEHTNEMMEALLTE